MPVPWAQIIQWTPALIKVSRELLQRARQAPAEQPPVATANPADNAARIATLENNQRRLAEIAGGMAEQIAQLTMAVVSLHRQIRWLWAAVALLAVGLAVALYLLQRSA